MSCNSDLGADPDRRLAEGRCGWGQWAGRCVGWAGCEVLLRGWGNSSRQEATAEIGR